MKAAVIYGAKDVRIEDIQEPAIKPGYVKVKVAWAGICGSDLHAYHHGMGISMTPHPVSNRQVPLTLGHEFAGTVVEAGEGVADLAVGDRVAIEPLIYADNDYYAKLGKYNLSNTFGFLGLNDDGGFAEYAVVRASQAHKLPDAVSLEEGALVEPTAVTLQAVKASDLKAGQSVIVFGAGPIGLLTIISAKAAGAADIIAVDISPERLEKAREAGASLTINSAEANVEEQVFAQFPNGVDVAYEAAGVQATFSSALNVLKKGGQLMVIAAYGQPVTLDVNQLLIGELKVTASLAYRHVFPEVIAMIASGRLNVEPVITKKIELPRLVEDGLELLLRDKSQAKILVEL
ncbi:2,3-butanediol dehydrogenase [Paenibacillus sp. 598K]|uniref:2,3-butanediol dehydrogenase n=1 Tax=Paenibacillus sp. 598K TaxID=1117987 RepID=UPI001627AAC2|nr:2,3-butanediol dehydrogenase [Paenibacillus sp. 598K]